MRPIFLILFSSIWLTAFGQRDSVKMNSCRGCQLLKNLDKSLKIIDDSAFWLIRYGFQGDCDSCFFGIVHKLRKKFILTSNTKYIIAMSNLARGSDGVYTEEFEDAEMFFKNFKPFCDYLYTRGDTGILFFCTIRELMFEMYYHPNEPDTAKIKEIKHFIRRQEFRYGIIGGEKKFIDSFIDRAREEGKLEQ